MTAVTARSRSADGEVHVGRRRRFVGGVDPGQAAELAGAGAGVEPLGVTRLAHGERRVDEHLDERQSVDGMGVAHAGPVGPVRTDHRHQCHEPGVGQQARHLADAPYVLGAVGR